MKARLNTDTNNEQINIKSEDSALLQKNDDIAVINLHDEIKNDELFGFAKVFKEISSLSLPMALSFTFSFEVFLIVIMLNYLNNNEDEVAATTLITAMMNTLVVVGMSPLFAMSIVASNKIGELNEAEKRGEAEDILQAKREYIAGINRNGLLLSMILTPPVMAGMIFSKPILTHVFGQNEKVAQITQDLLRVYSPAVVGLVTRVSSEQMMFSFGRAKAAMLLGLANLGIGTGLSAWLGFGGLGVPRLGPTGIMIGFVVEAYLTSVSYALYLAKHKDFEKFNFFHLFKKMEGRLKQLQDILKVSGPMSFAIANEMAMSLAIGILAGLVGTREQSAMTFVNQFVYFTFIALAAFGQSCAQEVSRQIGAKKFDNASRIGKFGLLTSMIYISPIPIIFAIDPNLLVLSQADKNDVKAILKILVPIISVGVISDANRYNLLQQLRALGDLHGSTAVSTSGLSLGMVVAGILGLKTKMGIYGVATGYTGGVVLANLGLLYRWLQRINPEKIKEVAELPASDQVSVANCVSSLFGCGKRNKYQQIADTKPEEGLRNGRIERK